MAGVPVEAGSALAHAIQSAVQPKLIENGWVAEENDTTLSEYVTMMMVNGKDLAGVTSELGGDLLGVGEDDPAVIAFAEWLFQQLSAMTAPLQQQQATLPVESLEMQPQHQFEDEQAQPIPSVQDSQMDDASPADGVPSGPKAMRNGSPAGRARGGRMLGQINNHLNREQNLPDPLRRIKGAASGQHGRIDSHAGRGAPRGPRGSNIANGVQRMMNNAGRGGRGGMNGNPMAQQNGAMMNRLEPNQQMAFMQMMEMQANMMSQMMQSGQMPNFNQQQQGGKSLFDRVDKRQANGHFKKNRNATDGSQNDDAASSTGMDLDAKKEPFENTCRFNKSCTNPTCPYAHQTPAAPPGQTIDMTDTCSFGSACTNHKCVGRHPSPAQRSQHLKQEVDCKFFPNCTNPSCPFKHPDMPLCRNGADCSVAGCKFTHSRIMCRYSPCTRPGCSFKHIEGQRGIFKDKVWSAGADGVPTLEGEGEGTSERFAEFNNSEGQAEELVLPGQQEGSEGNQLMHETQITT